MNNFNGLFSAKDNNSNTGDLYLKFKLNQQTTALMSMNHTQEAVILPVESVTAIPNMPPCVLGLMNWRSHIIWVIHLPTMLDLESINIRCRQYNVIVINVKSVVLGLVVREIIGISKLIPDKIYSPIGKVTTNLQPYLQGVFYQPEMCLVLDASSIINSPILSSEKV
ncbi:chemotaxis protein CheW [Anabaenopsis elenkinii]|jgi:positive phototaxis protein PixI|uniref:Purine-binding chemotaxis protein CheW n=1 Tax=Anabaenopsis elenkinii CCIBt3563 TaxID=2779889 RepID=A0A7S6RCN7_9CYAN|nr:chemotaxis protein CheW [Anabaenopsis elenkinii]QOV22220.1 purine-binding chemotaxis protein CheW [Anabaenopsis elenkinii CCIBt3563]